MKKILTALLVACFSLGIANAYEVNLLAGCYDHNENIMPDKEGFYALWKCYNENGNELTGTTRPDSFISKVSYGYDGPTLHIRYVDSRGGQYQLTDIPGNPTTENFPDNTPLLVLKYPYASNSSYTYLNMCYAFPISVPETGTYTISGSVGINVTQSSGFAGTLEKIIFVANPDPSIKIKSMETSTKNGKGYIKVLNQNNEELPSAFTPALANYPTFSKTIDLSPEDRYLTIYAPCAIPNGILVLCNLALKGDLTYTGIEEVMDLESAAATEYFDLSGRRVNDDLQKGIYIRKTGDKTEKILIR